MKLTVGENARWIGSKKFENTATLFSGHDVVDVKINGAISDYIQLQSFLTNT
jgi:hypothetical protein